MPPGVEREADRVDEQRGAPLAARELPELLERVHRALAARRELLDDLNVFPVPDGDTGTNMTLTVRSGLEALSSVPVSSGSGRRARRAGHEAARAVTRGVVRGARGNSGVILSQVIRAVVEVIAGHREVDARLYAEALARARDLAYEAVAEPVEGTMLSAISAAADAARRAADLDRDLVSTSAAVCAATAAAVEATREQLDVLRLAGVVDAGARGFEVVLAGVHGHLTGEQPPVVTDRPPAGSREADGGCVGVQSQPFEVQYLLDADDDVATPLRRHLESLGDSVVVVAAGGLLNVHVHTAQVGPCLEAGLAYGRASDIEVVHFGDQLAARAQRRVGGPGPGVGALAVLHGTGIVALARTQGAVVVDGRAGALPSVAELLDALDAADRATVVVLPGHRNVIPTAHSAAELARSESSPGTPRVEVVEAASTPPAVLAALAVLEADAPVEQVLADVHAAAAAVRAGAVVAAVRDADTPVGRVREGQPLAALEDRVLAACTDPIEALEHVCTALEVADAEVVSLLVGAEVDDAERAAALACVQAATDAEVEVLDAGLRPARFWIGVE